MLVVTYLWRQLKPYYQPRNAMRLFPQFEPVVLKLTRRKRILKLVKRAQKEVVRKPVKDGLRKPLVP